MPDAAKDPRAAAPTKQKMWSRFAVVLGVLACLASLFSWYYGLQLLAALLALLLALVGFLRGERSRAAWFWPVLAIVLGTVVYSFYLRLTAPADKAQAQQVLDKNFANDFEDDFANLVGDGGAAAAGADAAWPSP